MKTHDNGVVEFGFRDVHLKYGSIPDGTICVIERVGDVWDVDIKGGARKTAICLDRKDALDIAGFFADRERDKRMAEFRNPSRDPLDLNPEHPQDCVEHGTRFCEVGCPHKQECGG